jgi:hypothetical protein
VSAALQFAFNHLLHENGKQIITRDGGDISGDDTPEFEFEISAALDTNGKEGGNHMGHAYIGIRRLADQDRWFFTGFWPGGEVSKSSWSAPGNLQATLEDVPRDVGYNEYYSAKFRISRKQYDAFQAYNRHVIDSAKPYNLLGYNCVSYALRASWAIGLRFPSETGFTPAGLAHMIKDNFKFGVSKPSTPAQMEVHR